MEELRSPIIDAPPERRDAVVQRWLALTLESYPDQTAQFFHDTRDPFRNPVGGALREGLPVLFDQLAGPFDLSRVEPALDEIVHIRAIQDFPASKAVGFIFLLKAVVREELDLTARASRTFEDRVDRLAALAFDLYMRCREKLWEIKANAEKRQTYVPERMARGRG